MIILASETTGKSFSVALLDDQRLIAESTLALGYTHSETYLPELIAMLERTGRKLADVDLFAVAVGPGSYTGIRIGVCTVKALAYACRKPAVGVSSLAALASGFTQAADFVFSAIDARGGRLFATLWEKTDGELQALLPESNLDADAWLRDVLSIVPVGRTVLVTGSGSDVVRARWCPPKENECCSNNAIGRLSLPFDVRFLPEIFWPVRAAQVGELAFHAYASGAAIGDPALLTPSYCAPSQAERMRQQNS